MKKNLISIAVLAAIAFGYLQLPLEWRRHKDIKQGKQLVANLTRYQAKMQRLPEEGDEAVLQSLQFRKNKTGWQPNYRKLGSAHYRIVYADGYDKPYLMWDSQEQIWRLDQ